MNEYDCRHVLLSRYHIIVLRKSAEVSMTTQVFPLDGSAPPSPLAHLAIMSTLSVGASRQLVYGHFVYDTSSTDISSTDISSTMTFLVEIEAGVMKRVLYQ